MTQEGVFNQMDTRAYFSEVRELEQRLESEHGQIVHITSLKHRDKNSTAGATYSARPYNAARCIVDETHRLATKEEIAAFEELQKRNFAESTRSEAKKKQQVVVPVVMNNMTLGGAELMEQADDLVASSIANTSRKS